MLFSWKSVAWNGQQILLLVFFSFFLSFSLSSEKTEECFTVRTLALLISVLFQKHQTGLNTGGLRNRERVPIKSNTLCL